MKINIAKTKCMVFRNRKVENKLNLKISNKIIEQVEKLKYLGIILDEKLKFDTHFENTCKDMTKRLYMINRYRRYFSHRRKEGIEGRWRHIFSTSLVLSKLDYYLTIWGNLPITKIKRINPIILRLAKVVVKAKTRHIMSKIDKLEQLNWMLCHERTQMYTLYFALQAPC